MKQVRYIKAHFKDDDDLLKGIRSLKKDGIEILDVLTPFPVHGLDKILGYRRSRIARVGFIGGAIGCACGLWFQVWVFTKDYPLNIGGKPFLALPSFIPVTFELTVLFAAFAMVFAFLIRSKIGPGAKPFIHDEKITDDRFVVLVGCDGDRSGENVSAISSKLSKVGALDITTKKDVELSKNY
ncbi:MAG: DUF3341 domain-containing protein [Bacteroidales bacterium]|jgi:hypothetical protein